MNTGDEQVIVEYRVVGSLVRVSAVDPVTGLEAVIQGPLTAGKDVLAKHAIEKLKYILSKQNEDQDEA